MAAIPGGSIEQLQWLDVRVEWIDPQTIDQMIDALTALQQWSPQPQQAVTAAHTLRAQEAELRQQYQQQALVPLFLQFGQQPLYHSRCAADAIFLPTARSAGRR